MRIIQYLNPHNAVCVGMVDPSGQTVSPINQVQSTYALASAAIAQGLSLEAMVAQFGLSAAVDYPNLLEQGRVLSPLHHPDPAHCYVTGTGLTHLGSASARDQMHQNLSKGEATLTDTMRIFKAGLEGGQAGAQAGVQPEWFYKGDGSIVMAPGQTLPSPDFALDGGEEPEIVGLYLIGPDARPYRIGFAVGNEFSDHVTERQNYLYLAHSKLRPCAIGPEIRTGALPAHLEGTSRIRRDGNVIWEKPFITGEANMCHNIANLEYHHFKYAQ
ncbi:MAG: AraD1 family protein, partial [Pseudomonadota bacterium]